MGKLNLVDLVGLECVGKLGVEGSCLWEVQYINKLLLVLGDVIVVLCFCQGYVFFCNFKFIYLLQDLFSGDSKIFMVVQVFFVEKNISEMFYFFKFVERVCFVELGFGLCRVEFGFWLSQEYLEWELVCQMLQFLVWVYLVFSFGISSCFGFIWRKLQFLV